ncbi:94aa4d88-28d8-442d-8a1a-ff426d4237c5 [Thermothielavioides terrestris]|uniref:94aa4d88-28d8-442d-8a1a-ff426d4237c5 n=1 Tax=Thermothielavioides terrestris TaxID=2587410 RepID=A0A3S4CZK8_9PEZI|nr:94aa4d88-28d8-442d-8a1a-ff426d4237c5 [Thermothielavioides terrestris]
MAFIDSIVMEGARIALRQAAATAVATSSSLTSVPNSSPTTTIVPASSAASPTATDTSSLTNDAGGSGGNGNTANNNSNNGGGNSSSLLFFVALGFGVVFTNLWIIVGVKYCFRYNARNRQMRNDDGEPITLENMPRPHRRRREKKLMPIDEVNEKFPMLKYKTWVTSRAQEGLPTRGGVSAPPSRPSSIRHADGVVPELPSKEHSTTDDQPTTSATVTGSGAQFAADAAPENPEKSAVKIPQHAPKESTSSTVGGLARPSMDSNHEPETTVVQKHMSQLSHDDEDDDEHIDAALPPECVGTSGDTCAICIDTLEDDDDVRGLTCGHAFHAACIDPWLTTRRACCPLCKADYYTPKPRPQERVTEGADGTTGVIAVTLPGDNTRGHSRDARVQNHLGLCAFAAERAWQYWGRRSSVFWSQECIPSFPDRHEPERP